MNSEEKEDVEAAVALITCRGHILVLRRIENEYDPWSRQLSLPGGRIESDDRDLLHTALRETMEECGFELRASDLICPLPLAHAGRAHGEHVAVQPFHFHLQNYPEITLEPSEHDNYYWVSIEHFFDSENHESKALSKDYPEIHFPYITIEQQALWGFTYKVILNFTKIE